VDDLVIPLVARLNVGDRFTLSGKRVLFPFDQFTYEVTAIEDGTAKLRIIEPPPPHNCSNALA
jgi:hypothetical protein